MEVNAINTIKAAETAAQKAQQDNRANEKTKELAPQDPILKAAFNPGEAAVYEKSDDVTVSKNNAADPERVRSLIAESRRQTEAFQKMIERLLQKQRETAQKAGNGIYSLIGGGTTDLESLLGTGADNMVEIDDETRAAAQEAIGEDGYYGVKKTSGRILDFAAAVAGSDPKKLAEMKAAFEAGFKQAADMWGDKLPEISQKTYDAVMQGFADMEAKVKGGEPSAAM